MKELAVGIPHHWRQADLSTPRFVEHPSFHGPEAEAMYSGDDATVDVPELPRQHMEDGMTRDCARKMHYAAYRSHRADTADVADRWRQRYYALRDRIILGNRKLIFRAVRKWTAAGRHADDLLGECDIVMIRAVAAYNPWLGIRFSTYAFTCLMRALSRLSKRLASDRLLRAAPVDSLADTGGGEETAEPPAASSMQQVDEYLQDGNALLSDREKLVLRRRFNLRGEAGDATLAAVGRSLGLSKERVRQLQVSALGKLRQALLGSLVPS
jgi:RNA polymerase sigma factor (sigma-70 family)